MAVDPKLRDVLDTLDEEPANTRPDPDREMLISVLRRLQIREQMRMRRREMPSEPERNAEDDEALRAELEAAQAAAKAREDELARIARERDQSDEALRAAEAEREELRRKQEELERRLAELEAAQHGGQLSFVEDDAPEDIEEPAPVVEFTRVHPDSLNQASNDDELLEFEDISRRSAFEQPDDDAWSDETAQGQWGGDEASWADDTGHRDDSGVDWDPDDTQANWADDDPQTTWEQAHDDPSPYQETPQDQAQGHEWAEADDHQDEPWEQAHDDPAPWTEDTTTAPEESPGAWEAAPEQATAGGDQIDEKTQRDLNELERQLQELERELAKRQAVTGKRD